MSRTVVVQRWCDSPDHGDEPVAAVAERVVSVDGGRPVLLDLCAEHGRVIDALLLLMDHGAPPETAPTRGGRPPTEKPGANRTCPICHKESATRGALSVHLRTMHGSSLRASGA